MCLKKERKNNQRRSRNNELFSNSPISAEPGADSSSIVSVEYAEAYMEKDRRINNDCAADRKQKEVMLLPIRQEGRGISPQ